MQNDTHDAIIDNFERYFPSFASNMVRWYPSGKNTIIVQMNDGSDIEYNDVLNTIRNIREPEDMLDETEAEWRKNFSNRLIVKMVDAGYDQSSLAETIGVSQGSMSNYIHRKATPSAWIIRKLANALKCDVSELT